MNDLEWLARHVHEWPKGIIEGVICTFTIGSREATGIARDHPEDWPYTSDFYSKDQWLAERARLQDKPSWDDAPEWAEWLAQDENEVWTWFECDPEHDEEEWIGREYHNGKIKWASYGYVLGDWRDTLERRPVSDMPPNHENMRCVMNSDIEKIEPDWNIAPKWATRYGSIDETVCPVWADNEKYTYVDGQQGGAAFSFSEGFGEDEFTFTHYRKEWRGPEDGLPPVGTALEVWHDDGRECWKRAEVIGYMPTNNRFIAVNIELDHCKRLEWSDTFRPIRTEEDKAVEEWCAVIDDAISKYNINIDCSAAIKATIVESYRAGYRKQDASE